MTTRLFRRGSLAFGCAAIASLLIPADVDAQATTQGPDLRTLTLEQLMAVPVTVTNRVPQSRLTTPASVFVITSEEIRQSGAGTLPEVLRMVPGVHVAQIDGNKWAIGIRGFTDRLARAMLVLIDGRPVYSPLFAGTYWEIQDLPLSDIERIEVVRGPGGSLWGANAVTGVVNIVRKSAAASAGTTVVAGTGSEDPLTLTASHGGGGRRLQYRVSGKVATRSPQDNPLGLNYDDARLMQMGARAEWQNAAGAFMVQGDAYRTVIGQRDNLVTFVPPSRQVLVTDDTLTGANLMGRWTRRPADPRSLQVQVFYDYSTRSELVFDEQQHVVDIDIQQGLRRDGHNLLWGAGFRNVDGRTTTRGALSFTRPSRTDQLYSAFVQDEVALVPDRLSLTAGTKVEHNAYSGVEWQPSARLAWTVSSATVVSASIARAVRTPSRVEHDFSTGNLLNATPAFVRLSPNPAFRSEELTALEGSIVTTPHPNLLTTVAVFRNRHDHVLSGELFPAMVETDTAGSRVILPILFGNGLEGHSYGVEVTNDVRPSSWWRTTLNYSWLRVHLQKKPGSLDASQEVRGEGGSPRHQVQLATTWHLPGRVTVDWFLRGVSGLPALQLPGYVTSNLRLDWAFNNEAALFLQGRNLHQAGHPEFNDGANGVFDIQRAVVVGVRWMR
jgi:iron complex outermembrane receptor protein